MARVSILIPSRNESFLRQTVEGALSAGGDVEVLVLLDGAPVVEPLPEDPRLRVLINDEPQGIGAASWRLANEATGEYLMKLDAHCLLAEGYDTALVGQCSERTLCVPARYQLKDESWSRGYGPIHYLYVTYPWLQEPQFGWGLHGKKWLGQSGLEGHYFWPEKAWAGKDPDAIMAFQGSCWFIRRDFFLSIGGVDPRYVLWQEAQDICAKVWLAGGECIRVKNTWYAHLHKGNRHGRGYWLNKKRMQEANAHSADFWMNDRWQHPMKTRPWQWFVERFWPIPGWPEDWDNPRYQEAFLERG